MKSFAIIFQTILLRFKEFASKGIYYAGHVSVAASEQDLKYNVHLF